MKKFIAAGLTAIIMCWLAIMPARAGIDFEGKATELLGEILANPSAFFYDFQQDLE